MVHKEYVIDVQKLNLGEHQFEFQLENRLFEAHNDILSVNLQVIVNAIRTNRHIELKYHFIGSVEIACDRCLEPFHYGINNYHQMLYSFETSLQNTEEDDVVFISRNTHLLNLSQDFYDFVSLALPYRKIPEDCPKDTCPSEILNMFQDTSPQTNEIVDSQWEILKHLDVTDN